MEEKNCRTVKLLVVKIVFQVSLSEAKTNLKRKQIIYLNFFFILAQNIIRLQMAFASTLRKCKHDLDLLVERSWAIFWHKYSTNNDPHHDWCSVDWCGYLKAARDGTSYDHTSHSLPRRVLDAIKPVFESL